MNKKRLTYIILSVFLILSGLVSFMAGFRAMSTIIAILAIAAGVLILVSSPGTSNYLGWLLAAIYLILLGLSAFVNIKFSGMGTVMAVLALVAGILLLVRAPNIRKHLGFLLFCVWLILVGLTGLVSLGKFDVFISIVAIISGILMILNA
jgi:hypothetical protein